MELLTRFGWRTVIIKFHDIIPSRSLNLGNVLYQETPNSFSQIPDYPLLFQKYKKMKDARFTYRGTLKDEFLSECHLSDDVVSEKNFKTRWNVIYTPINVLQANNLISSLSSVTDEFLSYLEPFPFDGKEILEKEKTASLFFVRNIIEKEYLAWKYQTNIEEISYILKRLKFCLYCFRSLRSLKKNISLLETIPGIEKRSVAEKIYHLYQTPFDLESVLTFQDKVAGVIWHVFPEYCKKIMRHSHNYILFMVSVLQDLKFTEKQIQLGLPFLNCKFTVLMKKLNELLQNSKINKYRNEPQFLYLLNFETGLLLDLVNLQGANFEDLIQVVNALKVSIRYIRCKSVVYQVSQFYQIDYTHLKRAVQFINRKFVSESQMYETLLFLKENDFTSKEVEESLPIVFYPRDLIEKTLKKIEIESESFKKIGFDDGCVSGINFFKNGTKEERKILQLCLYYMEKPFHFSGDGIFVDLELNDA